MWARVGKVIHFPAPSSAHRDPRASPLQRAPRVEHLNRRPGAAAVFKGDTRAILGSLVPRKSLRAPISSGKPAGGRHGDPPLGAPGGPGIPGEGGRGDSSASFQTVRGRPRSERPEPPALNPPFLCLVGFSWSHFTVAPAEQPREGSARAWGAGFSGANRRSGSSPGRSYSPTAPPFSERMGGGGAHRPTGPGTAAGASRGRGATAAGEAAGQHAPGRRVRVRPEGC